MGLSNGEVLKMNEEIFVSKGIPVDADMSDSCPQCGAEYVSPGHVCEERAGPPVDLPTYSPDAEMTKALEVQATKSLRELREDQEHLDARTREFRPHPDGCECPSCLRRIVDKQAEQLKRQEHNARSTLIQLGDSRKSVDAAVDPVFALCVMAIHQAEQLRAKDEALRIVDKHLRTGDGTITKDLEVVEQALKGGEPASPDAAMTKGLEVQAIKDEVCVRCQQGVSTPYGLEPTAYCNPCSQELVQEYRDIIDKQAEQLKAKDEAIRNIPLREYTDALREGCSANCAWDCFIEVFTLWREQALSC
jgi:hypothetical protein